MKMREVGIGMVSFDHMHADSYASCFNRIDSCKLVGVADENETRGREKASVYSTSYMDLDELLGSEDVDAVCICSANSRHHDQVLKAAEAGKNVMVEKPIATSMSDALDMVEKCRTAGVTLQVAFVMRYSPMALKAKRLIDSGAIGEIRAISGTNHGSMPGGWFTDRTLSGGGAIMDHSVHVADLMNWFVGRQARSVFATGGQRLHVGLGIDDAGFVLVRYDGVIGSIDPSWSRPEGHPIWGDVTMRIFGSEETVELDGFTQNLGVTRRGGRYRLEGYGSDLDYHTCLDLVRSTAEGSAVRSTGEDGVAALEIALAAYRSIDSGQPVELGTADT